MPIYKAGDYVKFEIKDERTGESEWMCSVVSTANPSRSVANSSWGRSWR